MLRVRATVAILAFAACATNAATGAAEKCPAPRETKTTEFGEQRPLSIEIKSGGPERPPYKGSDMGSNRPFTATYYRFHIVPEKLPPPGGWTLTLRDQEERSQQILTPSDFDGVQTSGKGVWTRFVKAKEITFDLYSQPGSTVALKVVEAVVLPEKAPEIRYSWKGPQATYIPLYSYAHASQSRVRRSGDRVGFLIGRDQAEQDGMVRGVNWCCSGILLTQDLLLTNWHCGGKSMAAPAEMWRDGPDGRTCDSVLVNMAWDDGSVSREARCRKVELTSKGLDYALVRVAPVAGSVQTLSSGKPLAFAKKRPELGTYLRIIHHAECLPKLVSYNCWVTEAARASWDGSAELGKSEFAHNCDTEGGSSGAPVFNEDGELVGLHHLGYELIPGDPQKRCDDKNKAIHIGDIMGHLKKERAELYREIRAATQGLPE